MGRALRPIPQEKITLVGWAEESVLVIFARGLIFLRKAIIGFPVKVFSIKEN
jgi:hypothetical protein